MVVDRAVTASLPFSQQQDSVERRCHNPQPSGEPTGARVGLVNGNPLPAVTRGGHAGTFEKGNEMSEVGPVYGVELIDTLPMNYGQTKGMLQAMPSAEDLKYSTRKCTRVAAGYEVLLNHWREQAKELTRLQAVEAAIERIAGYVADLQRHLKVMDHGTLIATGPQVGAIIGHISMEAKGESDAP